MTETIVWKGTRGTLSAALPRTENEACGRLLREGVARGLRAFAEKTGADVTCAFTVEEDGAFFCVTAHVTARVGEKILSGDLPVFLKNGLPWTPSRKERKAFAACAAKRAERALRLGVPLFGDCAARAKRFWKKAALTRARGGFVLTYPPRTLAEEAKSFAVDP